MHKVRWYLLVMRYSTSDAVECREKKRPCRYVHWMSSYWLVGKSIIHDDWNQRLKHAEVCLECWISAVLHLLFSMTHILSASGELLIGSKKLDLKGYDSSPWLYKMRVMLRHCLKATNIGRSGCLFRWLRRARRPKCRCSELRREIAIQTRSVRCCPRIGVGRPSSYSNVFT